MYLGGPTFELGGPTFQSRVGPIFGRRVLENTPIPLFEQILNSSPMGVLSRDYGSSVISDTQSMQLFVMLILRIRVPVQSGIYMYEAHILKLPYICASAHITHIERRQSELPFRIIASYCMCSLVPRPLWEGETAWQLPRVQTVTSAARELEDPIRFQIAVT